MLLGLREMDDRFLDRFLERTLKEPGITGVAVLDGNGQLIASIGTVVGVPWVSIAAAALRARDQNSETMCVAGPKAGQKVLVRREEDFTLVVQTGPN